MRSRRPDREGEPTVSILGVISDTHGLVRPEAVEALRGVEGIIHAGDIGSPEVITALGELAPVTAVRGNCDRGGWAAAFPPCRKVVAAGIGILVLHDLQELKGVPPGEDVRVVISGHTHAASVTEKEGVLYLNPGSAGRKRFHLPVTLALLKVEGGEVSVEVISLSNE